MTRREFLATSTAAAFAGESRFSEKLWMKARPIYERTLAHPFLNGLADGTLPIEKFRYYMLQDAIYLGLYSKSLNILASKAPHEDWAQFFTRGAIECIATERKLHETFFKPDELRAATTAPTNLAYTNHILASVYGGGFAEGLAAVAPCYWIYWEVGKELKKRGSKSPAYQRWIDQYSGENYGAEVRQVIEMIDSLKDFDRYRFEELFLRSARYEYLFWDMAWRLEMWP